MGFMDNNEIAKVNEDFLVGMVGNAIGNGASVVTTFCTNLRAA